LIAVSWQKSVDRLSKPLGEIIATGSHCNNPMGRILPDRTEH
jgi:hypothetical protein